MIPDFKVCKDCKIEKPNSEFSITQKIYLASYCKKCNCLRNKKYREENREKVRLSQKKHRKENREKFRDCHRKYYKENTEKARGYAKKHYQENREKIKERNSKYQKRAIKETNDWYVRKKLKDQGFTNEQIEQHPELLEIKRLTIKINRL